LKGRFLAFGGTEMGGNENKRQKKLARRKSKRKKALTHKKKLGDLLELVVTEKLFLHSVNEPLFQCFASAEMFDVGIGNVLISRRGKDGLIAASVFLVDIFCLGVKNTVFRLMSPFKYAETLLSLEMTEDLMEIPPECARKLVEGAVAYAEDLGFSPHPDYQIARHIFDNIDSNACKTSFEFGSDGIPFYVSGPNESREDTKRILKQLERRCGPDGFEYAIMEEGMEDDFDEDDFFDEEYP
jgi:hypothetical protein